MKRCIADALKSGLLAAEHIIGNEYSFGLAKREHGADCIFRCHISYKVLRDPSFAAVLEITRSR
jgi:hypothetical protein